jgi:hypothetical protein
MKGRPSRCNEEQLNEINKHQQIEADLISHPYRQQHHQLSLRQQHYQPQQPTTSQQAQQMTAISSATATDLDIFCSSSFVNGCSSGSGVDTNLPYVDWDRLEEQLKMALKIDESSNSVG